MIAVNVIPPKGNQNGYKGDRQRETMQRNSKAKLYSHRTTANHFNWYFSFVLMKVHAGFWKATPDHFWAWSHNITIVHPHNNVDDLFNGKSVLENDETGEKSFSLRYRTYKLSAYITIFFAHGYFDHNVEIKSVWYFLSIISTDLLTERGQKKKLWFENC